MSTDIRKPTLKQKWSRLTGNNPAQIAGNQQYMITHLQTRYDLDRFDAQKLLEAGLAELSDSLHGEGDYDDAKQFQYAQHANAADLTDREQKS
jgi:hypothetical protein